MNENLGSKGGKQDRKRRNYILKKKKKKYQSQKEYEKLQKDKELKKIQLETLIKIIPIVVVGETYKVLTNKEAEIKTDLKKEENNFPNENHQTLTPKNKVEIRKVKQDKIEIKKALISDSVKKNLQKKEELATKKQKENEKKEIIETSDNKKDIQLQQEKNKIEPLIIAPLANSKTNENKKDSDDKPIETIDPKLSNSAEELKLKVAQNIKIIENYQNKLKGINYELKKLTFEYRTIEESIDNVYSEKEAEVLFEKLNLVIRKLEELKNRLKIDDIDKYDDNYICNLIEEYMKSFDDKKIVKEIKDSDLYILLSTKIEELDKEKTKLKEKVTSRKEKLGLSEKKLESIKEKYFKYDDFNKKLIDFETKQDIILRDLEEKIKDSTSIEEKVRIKVVAINNQSNELLKLLALQMMIPGLKNTKNTILATLAYMHFMRKVMRPKYEIKQEKYKMIKVTDYSEKIEQSLNSIDNISNTLEKTSSNLNKMINDFKTEYKDFFSQVPECNKILNNLLRVMSDLEEKEYELKQIKKQQSLNLEKNNDKIKKLNNQEVM